MVKLPAGFGYGADPCFSSDGHDLCCGWFLGAHLNPAVTLGFLVARPSRNFRYYALEELLDEV